MTTIIWPAAREFEKKGGKKGIRLIITHTVIHLLSIALHLEGRFLSEACNEKACEIRDFQGSFETCKVWTWTSTSVINNFASGLQALVLNAYAEKLFLK